MNQHRYRFWLGILFMMCVDVLIILVRMNDRFLDNLPIDIQIVIVSFAIFIAITALFSFIFGLVDAKED